jgi:hypothetical protein
MKKAALSLACITSILLFSTAPTDAAEKKIVFNTESIKHESGTGAEWCQDKCSRRSGPDVKSLLSEGWKIVSSSPKEVIGEQYWYVPCNTCSPHGCICIGTEFILEKDGPARKMEAQSTVVEAPDKETRTVPAPAGVEAPKDELDLLKKENYLLKRENELLKQENETLRNQLRSKQK